MRPFSTLRGRLLLVGALAIVPLLGAFVLARRQLTERAEAERQSEAVRLAATAADAHADVLTETRRILEALARAPGLNEPATVDCEPLFGDLYRSEDYFTAFAVAGTDGVTACMVPGGDTLDIGERPYFQRALETKAFALSDYHIGYISGLPVVTMAMPVLGEDSTVVAVLAAGLDLGELAPLPGDVTLPPGAHLSVVDLTGHVLYHAPDSPPVPGDLVPAEVLAAARATARDTLVELELGAAGRRTLALSGVDVGDDERGAHVIVSFSPEWIDIEVAEVVRPALLGIALGTLVLLGGLWAAVEVLVLRRIGPIVGASERLGRGDLSARSDIGGGDDEISRLGRTFDEMAANLQAARAAEAEWALRQVAESEERLRLVAETIDEVFWIWDPGERRYVYLSPAFEDIWGIPRETLLEDVGTWVASMHPEDREAMQGRMVDEGTLREGEHEYRIVRPDGEERWILSRTFAVRDRDGEVERYLGVAQDVTERKVLEDALLHATKLEAVGRLAGGVAHDFNNVLTAIQGHTQLIQEQLPDDHPVRADLEEIATSVQRAAGLTRQLLMFSRKQAVRPRLLDLNRIVEGTAGMLGRLIGEDVELVLDLGDDVPPVRGDLHQIEQVLLNLSVNARDAMPTGGTLLIETRRTTIERTEALASDVVQPGEYARIRVSDSGTGMSPEVLEHVFEPFFTTKPPGEGTGLGLATVYGIMKQSGGAIHVESAEGAGTTFSLYLPPSEGEPSEVPESPPPAPADAACRTVLVVEDEDGVRAVVERMLERLGCEVVSASSGADALALVEDGLEVHVLLTDVVMPGMNGLELHRRLSEAVGELPVVFMSGYPGFGVEDRTPRGAHTFLQKPFSQGEMARALDDALEREPNTAAGEPEPL